MEQNWRREGGKGGGAQSSRQSVRAFLYYHSLLLLIHRGGGPGREGSGGKEEGARGARCTGTTHHSSFKPVMTHTRIHRRTHTHTHTHTRRALHSSRHFPAAPPPLLAPLLFGPVVSDSPAKARTPRLTSGRRSLSARYQRVTARGGCNCNCNNSIVTNRRVCSGSAR